MLIEPTVDPKPVLDLLKIQTRAYIKCDSERSGSFEAAHNEVFPLPYQGGPNQPDWKGETCGFAITDARVEASGSATTLEVKITVENKYGGCCGRNIANAYGGYGQLQPTVTGVLHLPRPDAGTWNVDMNLELDHSSETGSVTGRFEITLRGTSGDPADVHPFSADFTSGNIPFHKAGIKPGVYDLVWNFPGLLRGCLGSRQGTRSESTTVSALTIVCRLN